MDIEDIKTTKFEGDFKHIRNLKDFVNLKVSQDVKYIMNIRTSEILRIILLTLSSAMAEEAMKTWGGVKICSLSRKLDGILGLENLKKVRFCFTLTYGNGNSLLNSLDLVLFHNYYNL